MSDLLNNIFSGNPMSTFIGKQIEKASSPHLETEDWGLNMEICDIINANEEEAQNAVRAFKKRMQQIEQDRETAAKSLSYLLTVIDTCVINCHHKFLVQVMTKDFIQDLVRLIGPKNNPPIEIQERVLRLIERWAVNFKNYPELSGVVKVYNDLKAKGVIFPTRDPLTDLPIEAAALRASQNPRLPAPLPANASTTTNQSRPDPLAFLTPAGDTSLNPVMLEGGVYHKITKDLDIVQSTITVFGNVMDQADQNILDSDDESWLLLEQLNTSSKEMKDRIVALIEKVTNEEMTIELLRLNDELNQAFIRYEKLQKKKMKTATKNKSSEPIAVGLKRGSNAEVVENLFTESQRVEAAAKDTPNLPTRVDIEPSLIDFKDDDSKAEATNSDANIPHHLLHPSPNPFAFLPGSSVEAKDTFSSTLGQSTLVEKLSHLKLDEEKSNSTIPEISAATKTTTTLKNVSKDAGPSTTNIDKLPDIFSREQDFVEIENWLSDVGDNQLKQNNTTKTYEQAKDSTKQQSHPTLSEEFDNFIASRALASGSQQQQQQSSDTNPKRYLDENLNSAPPTDKNS